MITNGSLNWKFDHTYNMASYQELDLSWAWRLQGLSCDRMSIHKKIHFVNDKWCKISRHSSFSQWFCTTKWKTFLLQGSQDLREVSCIISELWPGQDLLGQGPNARSNEQQQKKHTHAQSSTIWLYSQTLKCL